MSSCDALGSIDSQAYSLGIITNTYDALSRLTAVDFAQDTKRFTYSYDAVGNRSVMQIGDGGRFSYSYDAVNQLVSILNPYSETTTMVFDAVGQETKRSLGNGSILTYVYDTVGRNTVIEARKSDGTLHAMYTASYDAAGNRVTVLENDGAMITYSYDNTYQLTNERRSGANAYNNTFTFDAGGNRLTKVTSSGTTTYTADAADRLTVVKPPASSTATLTYDNNGNLTLEKTGAVLDTYTWDPQNRLTIWNTGTYSTLHTFSYDPDGHRVKRQLPSRTDTFLNDERNVVQVTGVNPVVYEQLPGEWGSVFSNRLTSVSKFYIPDFQGHTRLLLNTSQAITDTAIFDAWGTEVLLPTTSFNDLRQWGAWGYFRDSPTRSYAWHRHYRRDWGRWISADPIGLDGGMNLYGYVGNRAVMGVDPSGRKGLRWVECEGYPLAQCQKTCGKLYVIGCKWAWLPDCERYQILCSCGRVDCDLRFQKCNLRADRDYDQCMAEVATVDLICLLACIGSWFGYVACAAVCAISHGVGQSQCGNRRYNDKIKCIAEYEDCKKRMH